MLGTAGAAKKIEATLADSTFLVVYGDNLTTLDLAAMLHRHCRRGALATIAVFDRNRVPNTGMAGGRVVLGRDEQVLRFVEGSACDSPYVNAGVYLLEPAVLAVIPPDVFFDFGRDVFPALLERGGRIWAYPITGYCRAIDTPEALARAEVLVHDLQLGEEHANR